MRRLSLLVLMVPFVLLNRSGMEGVSAEEASVFLCTGCKGSGEETSGIAPQFDGVVISSATVSVFVSDGTCVTTISDPALIDGGGMVLCEATAPCHAIVSWDWHGFPGGIGLSSGAWVLGPLAGEGSKEIELDLPCGGEPQAFSIFGGPDLLVSVVGSCSGC